MSVKHPQSITAGPKFVDHEELHGRWAQDRLFAQASEGGLEAIGSKGDLLRFKRMHFCARRLNKLRNRYGEAGVARGDWQQLASRYQQCRNEIAANNLGLVYFVLGRNAIRDVDSDELLSAGMLAFTRAIDCFDPWRGIQFGTYACNAISRALWRCHAQEAKRCRRELSPLDTHMERTDWIDARRTEELALWSESLSVILADGRGGLSPIEKYVLSQRFPPDANLPRRTLSDVGWEVGLTKERIRQLEVSAMRKLRSALETDPALR